MNLIFKFVYLFLLAPLHPILAYDLWRSPHDFSSIAHHKIYYETYLRIHPSFFLEIVKHSYSFKKHFKKEKKFNFHKENGAYNLSKNFNKNWSIYAEAKNQRKQRLSHYNFMSGIKYSW